VPLRTRKTLHAAARKLSYVRLGGEKRLSEWKIRSAPRTDTRCARVEQRRRHAVLVSAHKVLDKLRRLDDEMGKVLAGIRRTDVVCQLSAIVDFCRIAVFVSEGSSDIHVAS